MQPWPLRLHPGEDLRSAIEAAVAARGVQAAFVVAGIGSLRPARMRLAGADSVLALEGDTEILTLAGSVAPGASHLHISVADAEGRVHGGHVLPGCTVRTTAELLLALLPGWHFSREPDAATGWAELVVQRADRPAVDARVDGASADAASADGVTSAAAGAGPAGAREVGAGAVGAGEVGADAKAR